MKQIFTVTVSIYERFKFSDCDFFSIQTRLVLYEYSLQLPVVRIWTNLYLVKKSTISYTKFDTTSKLNQIYGYFIIIKSIS